MRKSMTCLQEENKNLRKEIEIVKLDVIKSKIASPPSVAESPKSIGSTSTTVNRAKENTKEKKKDNNSERNNPNGKRNSQPIVTPIERKNKNKQIRRELSYPMDARSDVRVEETDLRTPGNTGKSKKKGVEIPSRSNKKSKTLEKAANNRNSDTRNKETGKSSGKQGNLEELWSKIIGRKERKRSTRETTHKESEREKGKERAKKRKPRKTSAIVITTGDRSTSYSEILAWARQSVRLNEEEVNAITTKRSATGGILLEIKGDGNQTIADKLTEALRAALKKYRDVKVHRPRQMAELMLIGMDVSVTREEVRLTLAREGGCSPDDITVGVIKTTPRGTGLAWIKCPLAAANKLEEKKRIKIGWASVKINLLPARQMQCYRCLRMGHTKIRCNSEIDRSNICYNCGQQGHKVAVCKEKTRCVLCEEEGKANNHKVGGPRCSAAPSRGLTGIFRRSPTKSPEKTREGNYTIPNRETQTRTSVNETPETDASRAERMDTEELEDSVASDLVEDHYEAKDIAGQP